MKKLVHPELSYKITGLCFKVHKILGRFCREKQYADKLEELLKTSGTLYQREFELQQFLPDSPKGNKVDFLIEDKIIIDIKAKNFITKEDYYQMQRYLKAANLELGLLVNFRSSHLKPKRVLNGIFNSGHSDSNSDYADRGNGYITLLSILVVGAIGVAVSVGLLTLGLSSSQTSFALVQSKQARALADACAEEALQQISDSTPFTGTGNLTLGSGTCSYTVTSQGGQNRTITGTGTVGTIVRKAKVIINKINPAINVSSWQEVGEF